MSPKKQQPNSAQRRYQQMVQKAEPKPNTWRNVLRAWVTGGLVCVVGQVFIDLYVRWMKLPRAEAANPAVATMILIATLLTGLGVYDNLARVAGAGLAVPVTGFANAVAAAALEYKREGLVYGVGSRMFQLAGSVIVFGVVTAFVVGLIHALIR